MHGHVEDENIKLLVEIKLYALVLYLSYDKGIEVI